MRINELLTDRWWLQMRETSHMVKFLIRIFLSLFSIVNHSQKSKLSFWITLSPYLSEVMIHHTFKNVLKITGCQSSRLCNVIRLQKHFLSKLSTEGSFKELTWNFARSPESREITYMYVITSQVLSIVL